MLVDGFGLDLDGFVVLRPLELRGRERDGEGFSSSYSCDLNTYR